jgi:hypothetical protein
MTREQKLAILHDRNVLLAIKAQPRRYAVLIDRMGGPAALEARLAEAQDRFMELLNNHGNPQAPTA